MNNSFEYVNRCTINRSKSKEAHLFSHSKRFLDPRTSKYHPIHAAAVRMPTTSAKPLSLRRSNPMQTDCQDSRDSKRESPLHHPPTPIFIAALPILTVSPKGETCSDRLKN